MQQQPFTTTSRAECITHFTHQSLIDSVAKFFNHTTEEEDNEMELSQYSDLGDFMSSGEEESDEEMSSIE
jgi:hypothetical protein